ncbi:MAG: DUF3574 domain-containing protein [Acidobacteria bacterium]|nr:DUF3574 domain-containing protein [Acidobacteriota bacterium]MBV9478094.1 DUF3574 domain-containing protein [Acidobacteriota bacterium]
MRRTLLALAFLSVLTSCTTMQPSAPMQVVDDDRLFCGLSIPDGGTVSERDLAQFLDEVVVTRFPDGFSVFHIDGHYNDTRKGPVAESSIVIEIIHVHDASKDQLVREIATEYRRRFRQQAVLRMHASGAMELIEEKSASTE